MLPTVATVAAAATATVAAATVAAAATATVASATIAAGVATASATAESATAAAGVAAATATVASATVDATVDAATAVAAAAPDTRSARTFAAAITADATGLTATSDLRLNSERDPRQRDYYRPELLQLLRLPIL